MADTITVNGDVLDWRADLDLFDVFRNVGYTLKVPVVLVKVNGETIVKSRWTDYRVPVNADITIRNVFAGG